MNFQSNLVQIYDTPRSYQLPPRTRHWGRLGALIAALMMFLAIAFVAAGVYVQTL